MQLSIFYFLLKFTILVVPFNVEPYMTVQPHACDLAIGSCIASNSDRTLAIIVKVEIPPNFSYKLSIDVDNLPQNSNLHQKS